MSCFGTFIYLAAGYTCLVPVFRELIVIRVKGERELSKHSLRQFNDSGELLHRQVVDTLVMTPLNE